MDINFNPNQLTKTVSHFLHRYHVLIFAIVAIGGLSFATFRLYSIINAAAVPDAPQTQSTFDQATIEKIKGLRSADEAQQPLKLPSGRINPFK